MPYVFELYLFQKKNKNIKSIFSGETILTKMFDKNVINDTFSQLTESTHKKGL